MLVTGLQFATYKTPRPKHFCESARAILERVVERLIKQIVKKTWI